MKGRMKVKNSGKALAGPFTGKGQGKASGDYSLGFGISKATPIVNQIITPKKIKNVFDFLSRC